MIVEIVIFQFSRERQRLKTPWISRIIFRFSSRLSIGFTDYKPADIQTHKSKTALLDSTTVVAGHIVIETDSAPILVV